jgi:hypothetical protein
MMPRTSGARAGDFPRMVRTGPRRRGSHDFMKQFPHIASEEGGKLLASPADEETYRPCKLDHGDRERNAHVVRAHRGLLALRREDPVLAAQDRERMHGAVGMIEPDGAHSRRLPAHALAVLVPSPVEDAVG